MMGKDERARAEAAGLGSDVSGTSGVNGAGASSSADSAVALVDDSVVERRNFDRFDVEWSVDCVTQGDTFLYASITNISEMGIFVRTTEPLKIGTLLRLAFAPPGAEPFKLEGAVAWINRVRTDGDNPNPGMGIRFVELELDDRERLVDVIRTIAYLRELPRVD